MAAVATRLLKAEEFFDFVHLPENRDKVFELVRGEVEEMSRPGITHGIVCINAGFVLLLYARRKKKGYVCSNDTGVIVERDPDTVRGPDVMYFEENIPFEKTERKFAVKPPLVSVEVMSPSDTLGKVNLRVQEQLRFGVKLVWVIDPQERTVSIYRLGREVVTLGENEELTGEDALPDFRVAVSEFFAMPADQDKE